jgi:predicted nucleic acid-binding protein
LLVPDRQDHVEAAELRNLCRRRGVQVGTIDTLLAQLCLAGGDMLKLPVATRSVDVVTA